jgi:Mrp family chromosome partitioning ATPase
MTSTRAAANPDGTSALALLRILRDQWLIVTLSIVVCVFSGLIARQLVPSSYTAHSDLLISPVDPADDTFIGINVFRNVSSDPTANSLALARYLDTAATAEIVKRRLRLHDSTVALLSAMSVVPVSQTNIASISTTSSSARTAQVLANAFADAAVERRTQEVQSDIQRVIARLQDQLKRSSNPNSQQVLAVQQRLATLRSLVGLPDPTLSILNLADSPGAPNTPSAKLVAVASALAGILLGLALALIAETYGGKIRREDDLQRYRLPVLARVPRLPQKAVKDYFAGRANLPPAAWEPYRSLRANILRTTDPGQTPVIVVTSAGAGDGKTLTALNLAITLAAQDMRVILVDGDFRRPMIGSIFGIPAPRDGFTSTFVKGDGKAAMVDVPLHSGLRLLLPTLHDLTQIDQLDADGVAKAFATLRGQADAIVVDSAPAGEVSDALLLASAADFTLIAVRTGHTRRQHFDALRDALAQYGIAASGLVVAVQAPPAPTVDGSTMPVAVDLRRVLTGVPREGTSRPSRSTRSNF